mmetsp:Transcript_11716/g.17891  ORF Transcript_11716/g.17891 Transcript_11716/m.17891 type:complete len:113 (+) Transcript_11716:3244-3582(+)
MKTAQKVKKDLMDFRQYLPIIRALCNPGLQKRHIEVIRSMVNIQDDKTQLPDMSIEKLKNLDILSHKDKLEDISDKASKEWSNQKIMDKMKEEWVPLEFTCVDVPGKDSFIL